MTDDLVFKTIRLPLLGPAKPDDWLPPAERETRVLAHMARVAPMVDFIRREEREAARRSAADPITRHRKSDRKFRVRELVKAQLRARAIAERRTT